MCAAFDMLFRMSFGLRRATHSSMRLAHVAIVGVFWVLPCNRAGAQTQSSAAGQPAPAAVQPRVVQPGDSSLRPLTATGATTYALTLFRDGDEVPVGRLLDTVRVDTVDGNAVYRRVLTTQRGTLRLIDSTDTDARTLSPRRRRTQQQERRVLLDFTGRRVKGSLAPQDVPSVPVDTTLPFAAFDAGNWDLVLRAMPLAAGYQAQFVVFDIDVGLRRYLVAVTGTTTLYGEPTWVVKLTLGRGRESIAWIGQNTGRLLQLETTISESTMLRQVLSVQN
ncbi:MAG: hypothetical protein IBJ03_07725 [Gemmatimonadaceae bacterium]|nr:hypothetical protein [Gemmatimonadaceae bacterium]